MSVLVIWDLYWWVYNYLQGKTLCLGVKSLPRTQWKTVHFLDYQHEKQSSRRKMTTWIRGATVFLNTTLSHSKRKEKIQVYKSFMNIYIKKFRKSSIHTNAAWFNPVYSLIFLSVPPPNQKKKSPSPSLLRLWNSILHVWVTEMKLSPPMVAAVDQNAVKLQSQSEYSWTAK